MNPDNRQYWVGLWIQHFPLFI